MDNKVKIIYKGKVKYLKQYFDLLEDRFYGYTLKQMFDKLELNEKNHTHISAKGVKVSRQ